MLSLTAFQQSVQVAPLFRVYMPFQAFNQKIMNSITFIMLIKTAKAVANKQYLNLLGYMRVI